MPVPLGRRRHRQQCRQVRILGERHFVPQVIDLADHQVGHVAAQDEPSATLSDQLPDRGRVSLVGLTARKPGGPVRAAVRVGRGRRVKNVGGVIGPPGVEASPRRTMSTKVFRSTSYVASAFVVIAIIAGINTVPDGAGWDERFVAMSAAVAPWIVVATIVWAAGEIIEAIRQDRSDQSG